MKIVVSIVNYNTKDLTEKCLQSLGDWPSEFEVWVVDNASVDESVEMIAKFPRVKLIKNKTNVGFGKAHNQVFNQVLGDYYIVLNSDAEVEEGTLEEITKFMVDNPECGLAGCKVLGFDGKLQPSAGDQPIGLALISWLYNLEIIGIKKSFHRTDSEYYENVHEVGWVSGNFFIISQKALKKVSGFNEKYFMYFEDTELCYRIKKSGFTVMINPKVVVKHLSGGSLDNPRLRQWVGEYRGLLIFYKGLYGDLVSFLIRILIYKSIILRMLAFAITGKLNYSFLYAKVITSL